MLNKIFSSKGRIRRSQYIPTYILLIVGMAMTRAMIESGVVAAVFILIPMLWVFYAQGARRAHDRGSSGWMQLIPFYNFYLLFVDSVSGSNIYGDNPKRLDVFVLQEEPVQQTSVYKPTEEVEDYEKEVVKKKVQVGVSENKPAQTNTYSVKRKSKESVRKYSHTTNKEKLTEETIITRVMRAVREGRDIIISYTKYNGEHSERRVSNIELSNDYTEWGYANAHIKGYCHLRNEERTFRISRIQSLEVA